MDQSHKAKHKLAGRSRKHRNRVVAITGVNGFIGSNLFQRLNLDPSISRIVAIDVQPAPSTSVKARYHKVDLTEPLADAKLAEILEEERADTFVHLAFLGSPAHNTAYGHELESVGTMYVLHACSAVKGVEKLIVGGSTLAYGAHPKNPNYLTEEHPLQANPGYRFVSDKVDVERQVARFVRKNPSKCVTILRNCPILGPTIKYFITQYYRRLVIMTLLGYDPLMQFVHEEDVIEAFNRVVDIDAPGIYNIVGKGVLPLSTVIRLLGRVNFPVSHFAAYPLVNTLWISGMSDIPAQHLDYHRYLCVADGAKAEEKLSFVPKYSTKDAALAFAGVERLRRVHLVQ
ncbi:MAG: NAD-dependent epimerase/dehydratase family protein [Nitrospirae bacterium]|nr:NAD-dependent epimerase/dehydratase family protein [Nitrospirota bacterium]